MAAAAQDLAPARVPPEGGRWDLPLVAFVAALALYLFTMAPTVYNLDSAELTTAAYTGGLVRATGYPLYLAVGRVWSRLPVGDVGYRMNLLSAVAGAATLALAARILVRLGIGPWASLGALGLLMTATYFWAMSLVAEVYTLHTALMCGLVLALLRWAERPSPGRLALATWLIGVGFGNQVAMALLAPGCLWYVLCRASRQALQARSVLAGGAGLLAGLAIYLYLPLVYLSRPVFNYVGGYDADGRFVATDLTTLQGLWHLVSGRDFAHLMLAYSPGALLGEVSHLGAELTRASVGVGVGPALLGLIVLTRRNPRFGVMLLLMFAISAGFYLSYRVPDKDTMFLPVYVIWFLWLAVGYQWLLDWLGQGSEASSTRGGARPLQALIAGAVVFAAVWNGPLVDLSDDDSSRAHGEEILASLEPGALLIGWWDTVPVVTYLQLVEGRRPDVEAINRFSISNDNLRRLVAHQVDRRPVYLDSSLFGLFPGWCLEPTGPVHRLDRCAGERSSGATATGSGDRSQTVAPPADL